MMRCNPEFGVSPCVPTVLVSRIMLLECTRDPIALTKLGGWTAGSEASKRRAGELAERMRPILAGR